MPQLKGLLSLGAPPTTVDPQGRGDSDSGAAPSARGCRRRSIIVLITCRVVPGHQHPGPSQTHRVGGPERTASDSAANLASWPSDGGGGWRPCACVPWASRVLVLPPSSHARYRPLAVCRRRSASCVATIISAGCNLLRIQ